MHLVLNSFGASIRKENSVFSIATTAGKQSIHPRDVHSITISKAARISSDAVLLAIQHEVDVIFVDETGQPKGRVWSVQYGSISDIRRKQIEFFYSIRAANWVKDLVIEKINNQIALLLTIQENTDGVLQKKMSTVINGMEDYKNKARKIIGASVSDIIPSLRGWEGAASRRYFQIISETLPNKYQFDNRNRRPAYDPFNALLNYGYGMLYGKIEGALIKAGIDPYVGIFHRDDYNRPALVYDIIEKYRIWIDFVVIQLCAQDAMNDECFIQKDNGIWLDGLGKRILIQSVNDYLSEIIKINGLERSRVEHIQQYAHQLAQYFLKTPALGKNNS